MNLLLHVSAGRAVAADAPPGLSAEEGRAFQQIATAARFCSEAVGADGDTPPVVLAFRTLIRSARADAAFKRLLEQSTTAGKLYALCGLYYTAPAFFEQAVRPFRGSTEEVQTFMGCELAPWDVGSLVEDSGPGAVRLKSREQTIQQWAAEAKVESVTLDIVGGGWPCRFKGA